MNSLTANLKLFYQCRSFSIVYAAVLICCLLPFWLIPRGKNAVADAIFITMFLFFIAFITAVIQITIAAKPFSILLPDRSKIQRQFFFILGGFAGLISSFIYLSRAYPTLGLASLWTIIAAVSASMAFFLLIVSLTFRIMPAVQSLDFPLFMFLYLLISALIGCGFYATIHSRIFFHPFPVLIIAGSAIAAFWTIMSNMVFALKYSQRAYRSSTAPGKHRQLISVPMGKRERLFLSLMSGSSTMSLRRVIWGSLYTRLESYPRYYWYLAAFILILSSITAGYLHACIFVFIGYIGLIPLVAGPLNNPLPLAMGRTERLISSVVIALVESIVAMAIALAAFGAVFLASYFMPMSYRVPSMRLIYLPLILMPLHQAFFLSTAQKRYLPFAILLCALLPLYFFFMFRPPMLSHPIGLLLVLLANAGLWGLITHECLCRDLAVSNR
jgi:hypothetical protein